MAFLTLGADYGGPDAAILAFGGDYGGPEVAFSHLAVTTVGPSWRFLLSAVTTVRLSMVGPDVAISTFGQGLRWARGGDLSICR